MTNMDPIQKFVHSFRVNVHSFCCELETLADDVDNPNRNDAILQAMGRFTQKLYPD